MSFFSFSSKEKIEKVSDILDTTNDCVTKTITKVIDFEEKDIEKYVPIQINDFFNPCYANIRPKTLFINITNYNQNIVKECTFSYLHTPLIKSDFKVFKRCDLSVQKKFEKTIEHVVNTPYMTCCQTDESGNVIDIDISQITNVNMIPSRSMYLSLGSVFLIANRITTGKCSMEISLTLKYIIKNY